MEHSKKTQRGEIRFLVGLGIKPSRILLHIRQAHQGHALSQTSVFRWAKCFRDGDLSTDNKPCPRRPPVLSEAIVRQIQNTVNVSPNISLRALSVACGVSVGTVHTALRKKLQLRKRPCCWVPHDLTDAQKQQRLQISQRNLRAIRRDTAILTRLVTGDESWFLTYDPTQKQQSRVWIGQNDARPQKPRRDQRAIKVMLVLFLT